MIVITSLIKALINLAIKKFITTPIASAVAKIIPQHTILKGSLLGFSYCITTRDVGKIIISNSLEHLLDRALPFEVTPLTVTNDKHLIFQTKSFSEEATQLLRAFNINKSILTKHFIPRKIDAIVLNNFVNNILQKNNIIRSTIVNNLADDNVI